MTITHTKTGAVVHDTPDIELEQVKREQAERMKIQPTQLWFRPADADLETVKKIIGVTTTG